MFLSPFTITISAFERAFKLSLSGPDGIAKPLPTNWLWLKQTILKDGRKDKNYDEVSGNKHTVLLPEREFNSYPIFQKDIDNGKFKGSKITDDDFIIHFMAHKSYDRIKYISEINKKLNII